MKVASFFAELGFTVTGEAELKAFETSLTNIATQAKAAMDALRGLATVKMPKMAVAPVQSAAPSGQGAGSTATPSAAAQDTHAKQWWVAFQAKQKLVNGLMAPTTSQPNNGLPTSALQGLKALGMFALKLGGIVTVALVLKKLVSTLISMTGATMKASVGMEKFTGQTGISRATLKAWELAAAKAGVSADETEAAFKHLTRVRQDIAWGRDPQAAAAFGMIGVDVSDTPENVFYKLGNRLKQMGPAQAQMFGAMAGFTDDWNYFLRQQTEKVQDMSKLVLSGEQQATVMQLNSAWQTLTFTLGLLRDKLVYDIAPEITRAISEISEVAKFFAGPNPSFGGALKALSDSLADFNRAEKVRYEASHPEPISFKDILHDLVHGGATNHYESHTQVDVTGQDRPRETAREFQRVLNQTHYQRGPAYAFARGSL